MDRHPINRTTHIRSLCLCSLKKKVRLSIFIFTLFVLVKLHEQLFHNVIHSSSRSPSVISLQLLSFHASLLFLVLMFGPGNAKKVKCVTVLAVVPTSGRAEQTSSNPLTSRYDPE